jgi:dTDP-4-dehydrorhamnose 3,5-epimerase
MQFDPAPLAGAFTIKLEPRTDERGFFARTFCAREFAAAGLETNFVQSNASLTKRKGTVRGFHYQLPPSAEVKLVRCVRGSIHDIIIDIRPDSSTFLKSFGADLTQDNRVMMYVPRGFAHGFMSLTDNTELSYMVSAYYDQRLERGLRYNDPALNVTWPLNVEEVSAKDAASRDFNKVFHGVEAFRGQ